MTPEMNSNDRDECLLKAGGTLHLLADTARTESMRFLSKRGNLSEDEYNGIAPQLETKMQSIRAELASLGMLESTLVKLKLDRIQYHIGEIRSAMGWDKSRESWEKGFDTIPDPESSGHFLVVHSNQPSAPVAQ